MTYYKVLDSNGNSQHGGSFSWSLPEGSGEAAVPGEWHEVPEASMCVSGFHLTTDPTEWWKSGSRCFVAEAVDVTEETGSDKVVCRRVRLCRELSAAELALLNIFTEGEHEVRGTVSAVADGTASVEAYDSSSVEAFGSSSVRAYDSSSVWAYDSSSVRAYDSSSVTALGSSNVWAYGSSSVRAFGSSRVEAYNSSSVRAYDSSRVTAYDSSITIKWNPGVSVALNGQAALVDRSSSVHTIQIGA